MTGKPLSFISPLKPYTNFVKDTIDTLVPSDHGSVYVVLVQNSVDDTYDPYNPRFMLEVMSNHARTVLWDHWVDVRKEQMSARAQGVMLKQFMDGTYSRPFVQEFLRKEASTVGLRVRSTEQKHVSSLLDLPFDDYTELQHIHIVIFSWVGAIPLEGMHTTSFNLSTAVSEHMQTGTVTDIYRK